MNNRSKAWIYLSTTGTNFLCLGLGMLSGIISARLLGPAPRGEQAIILYFPGLMSSFCCLAIPQALSYHLLREPESQEAIVVAGVRLSFALAVGGALLFSLVAPFTLAPNMKHLAWPVAIACLVGFPMVMNPHLYALHRGLHNFGLVNLFLLLTAGGYIVLLVAVWGLGVVTPLSVALCTLTMQLIVTSLSVFLLKAPVFTLRVEWPVYRRCLLHGLKLFVPVAALTAYGMSDRALLMRLATLTDIGLYAVAFAVGFPLAMVSEAFTQIGFIEVAGIADPKSSVALLTRRFQMAQVVVLGATLLVLPLVHPVVRYGFGTEFLPAVRATQFLVLAMALRGLSKTLENTLRARNLTLPGISSSCCALFCLAVFSYLLVPAAGLTGFAEALLLAELAGMGCLILSMKLLFQADLRGLWGLRPGIVASLGNSLFVSLRTQKG